MALTAREWLLLPRAEQEERKGELSPEECFKLRMELSMIHFTEEEKINMSDEKRYDFTHPKQMTEEEKADFRNKVNAVKEMLLNGRRNDSEKF